MREALVLLWIAAALTGCDTSNCGQYKDQAACAAVSACHWNANESVCKS